MSKKPLTSEQKERNRLNAAQWRAANRERHRAYQRQYRRDHLAETASKNAAWAKANPHLMRAYHKKSRDLNPHKYKAIAERWRAKNPDARPSFCAARRAKQAAVGGTFTRQQWTAMKARYGHLCLCCHQKLPLTRDHVVPIDKGGLHSEENIQPLCLRCNSAKGTKIIDYRPKAE